MGKKNKKKAQKLPFKLPPIKRQPPCTSKDLQARVEAFGQNVGYQISTHNIPEIWKETQGEGITIAVLDTGYHNHEDLMGSIQVGSNFSNSENINDNDGHSTHCSGIIAAKNNNFGIVGVAPKAQVISVKVLNDDGEGALEWVARGIMWAVSNKVDIISMSLGGESGDQKLHNAIQAAYNANIPVICAAGNYGDIGEVDFPARYPETISIGALDVDRLRADWSQTGPNLDFMAPGVEILSTVPTNKYAVYSGTSMATPWAAGVVALMIAKHRKYGGNTPVKTVDHVKEHLQKTAIDLANAGKDQNTGYGLIDVTAVMQDIQKEYEQPQQEGDAMAFQELQTQFQDWANKHQEKLDERENLQKVLAEVQEKLATLDNSIAADIEKAEQIKNMLQA